MEGEGLQFKQPKLQTPPKPTENDNSNNNNSVLGPPQVAEKGPKAKR